MQDIDDINDWPLGVLVASVFAHPLMVLATRVQCNICGIDQAANKNTFTAARNIWRTMGLKGFYTGYLNGLIYYTCLVYSDVYSFRFNQPSEDNDEENDS